MRLLSSKWTANNTFTVEIVGEGPEEVALISRLGVVTAVGLEGSVGANILNGRGVVTITYSRQGVERNFTTLKAEPLGQTIFTDFKKALTQR